MFLLLGIAGVVFFKWSGLSAGSLTAVGMLTVMVGAYRAYDRVSQERDELQAQLEHDTARFTIEAAVPYAGIPSAVNSLIVPDVYVLNRSDASLELTFTLLAADGSGPFESATTSARTVSAGDRSLAQPHAS